MAGPALHNPAPSALLIIMGFMASRATHIPAELGIADLMAEDAQAAAVLAERAGTHMPSLRRLFRAVTAIGFLTKPQPAHFALTPLGMQLRTGVQGSVRNLALMFGGERAWRSWGDLRESVRTSEPAAIRLYGMNAFDYMADHPEQAAIFNAAMAENTRAMGAAAIDFARFCTIVDVGGGNGALLVIILAACPTAQGIVCDLPTGCDEAPGYLEAAGVTDRCSVESGAFFSSLPAGGDAYTLKNVIHDWDDQDSIAILRRRRAAMPPKSTLSLINRMMREKIEAGSMHQQIAMMDMLIMPGGPERIEQELTTLLQAAASQRTATNPLPDVPSYTIIKAPPDQDNIPNLETL